MNFSLFRNARLSLICCFLAVGALTLTAAAPAHWPQFRGADSMGVADGSKFPERWSTNQNVAWKTAIPGRGWSSPIVWGEKVFLTTVTSEDAMEAPKKGLYFGGDRKAVPSSVHRWLVLAHDLKSGRELWRQEVHHAAPRNPLHVKNTYASETPVTDGERVYAYFGNVGLFCFDLAGRPLWSTNWPAVKTRNGWGSAASPVLHGGRLFVVNDNDEKSFLSAFDARSGRPLWRVERDEKSNWATPYVWVNDQRTELITPGTRKVRSYDLEGKLLWELGGMSSIVIPTPFAHAGLLYVCSGYVGDKTRPVFAIRPGATSHCHQAKPPIASSPGPSLPPLLTIPLPCSIAMPSTCCSILVLSAATTPALAKPSSRSSASGPRLPPSPRHPGRRMDKFMP